MNYDDTMTLGDVIAALEEIQEEFGDDIPVMMLPEANNEPYVIAGVNVGYDEDGKPVANFTSDD